MSDRDVRHHRDTSSTVHKHNSQHTLSSNHLDSEPSDLSISTPSIHSDSSDDLLVLQLDLNVALAGSEIENVAVVTFEIEEPVAALEIEEPVAALEIEEPVAALEIEEPIALEIEEPIAPEIEEPVVDPEMDDSEDHYHLSMPSSSDMHEIEVSAEELETPETSAETDEYKVEDDIQVDVFIPVSSSQLHGRTPGRDSRAAATVRGPSRVGLSSSSPRLRRRRNSLGGHAHGNTGATPMTRSIQQPARAARRNPAASLYIPAASGAGGLHGRSVFHAGRGGTPVGAGRSISHSAGSIRPLGGSGPLSIDTGVSSAGVSARSTSHIAIPGTLTPSDSPTRQGTHRLADLLDRCLGPEEADEEAASTSTTATAAVTEVSFGCDALQVTGSGDRLRDSQVLHTPSERSETAGPPTSSSEQEQEQEEEEEEPEEEAIPPPSDDAPVSGSGSDAPPSAHIHSVDTDVVQHPAVDQPLGRDVFGHLSDEVRSWLDSPLPATAHASLRHSTPEVVIPRPDYAAQALKMAAVKTTLFVGYLAPLLVLLVLVFTQDSTYPDLAGVDAGSIFDLSIFKGHSLFAFELSSTFIVTVLLTVLFVFPFLKAAVLGPVSVLQHPTVSRPHTHSKPIVDGPNERMQYPGELGVGQETVQSRHIARKLVSLVLGVAICLPIFLLPELIPTTIQWAPVALTVVGAILARALCHPPTCAGMGAFLMSAPTLAALFKAEDAEAASVVSGQLFVYLTVLFVVLKLCGVRGPVSTAAAQQACALDLIALALVMAPGVAIFGALSIITSIAISKRDRDGEDTRVVWQACHRAQVMSWVCVLVGLARCGYLLTLPVTDPSAAPVMDFEGVDFLPFLSLVLLTLTCMAWVCRSTAAVRKQRTGVSDDIKAFSAMERGIREYVAPRVPARARHVPADGVALNLVDHRGSEGHSFSDAGPAPPGSVDEVTDSEERLRLFEEGL